MPENLNLPSDIDQETGVLTDDAQFQQTISDLERVIAQQQAFEHLKSTPGWKIYEKFVTNQVENLTNMLKVEENFDKIRRIQSELIAFESLFKIIEQSFIDADAARKQLDNLIGPS